MVGRLERWKRTDVAVEAFNRLGLPLDVIGTGPEEVGAAGGGQGQYPLPGPRRWAKRLKSGPMARRGR